MGVPSQGDLEPTLSSGIPGSVSSDHSRNTGVAQRATSVGHRPQQPQKYRQQKLFKTDPKLYRQKQPPDTEPKRSGAAVKISVIENTERRGNCSDPKVFQTANVAERNPADRKQKHYHVRFCDTVNFAANGTPERDQRRSESRRSSLADVRDKDTNQREGEESDSKPCNTATFAAKETTHFDSGDTVEMWFMCRWLSRRRRSSTPDCASQQEGQTQELRPQRQQGEEQEQRHDLQQQQGEHHQEREHQQKQQQDPHEHSQPQCTNADIDTYSHLQDNESGVKPGMDGTTEDEEGSEVEGLMLDTEVDISRECISLRECDGATCEEVAKDERSADLIAEYGGGGDGDNSLRTPADGIPGMERDDGLREQLAMVEAMVQEMKMGFMAALEQLSSMQDAEQGGWQKVESSCQRHDTQITDISASLDSLRQEVSALSSNMGKVVSAQQSLQDQLSAMQTSQQNLLEELISAGVLSEKSRASLSQADKADRLAEIQSTLDTIEGNLNNHGSSHLPDAADPLSAEDEGDKTGVTAAACKSLSLTQALAARCQDLDVSDSSEEDLESNSPRRKHGEERRHKGGDNSADAAQRQQAVQDIVDSEEEYCAQLWIIVNSYQRPLQEGHYMSSRHLSILFPAPLSELCEQHSQMLHSLQDRLVHWSYAGVVGDVFARMTDSNSNLLGVYQEYVESLPASISCLRRQLVQSRNLRAFVKAQREMNGDLDLLSLLISPLQRVPKYMLQLQQVLRYTSEDHPDYFNLQASLSKLQDFVERFNHDITHTTQAIALDLQHLQAHGSSFRSNGSGSSCEILPATTSTIDSGIHSAEDSFSRRNHHSHEMYIPNWLNYGVGYGPTDPRHSHAMGVHRLIPRQSLLATHSQPDLTFSSYPAGTSPFDHQGSVPQIRSQSKVPPAGERSARQRRYKIKKRIEGQRLATSEGRMRENYLSPSPQMRPASAIDFVTKKESPQRPEREQAAMRPHSVLGPFPGDGRNRVIQVYSRKQLSKNTQGPHNLPLHHQAQGFPQPHIVVNGHWNPSVNSDTTLNDRNYGLVDYAYDDEEDDTRAMSDAPSIETSSSHKPSSRHSQDAHETETDNSEDYTQEDLAASLSHHLTRGTLPPKVSTWSNSETQQLQFIASKLQANGFDNDTDYLDSPESGIMTTDLHLSAMPPQQQPLDDMSELKLDLTCFHDDEGQSSVKKAGKPAAKEVTPQLQAATLSMQPMALNVNSNALDVQSQSPDPSQKEEKRGVAVSAVNSGVNSAAPVNSASMNTGAGNTPVTSSSATNNSTNSLSFNSSSGASTNVLSKPPSASLSSHAGERKRTLPAVKQDLLPDVGETNSRTVHTEFDRPPLRRSATPQEHGSSIDRPLPPRSMTPSAYIGASEEVDTSQSVKMRDNGRRRSKDAKHTSTENLHRSVEDVSSKKRLFRTSLKNLFNRKKGSVILDELEREYTKELVRQCLTKNGHTPTHTPTTHPATTTTAITTKNAANGRSGDTTPTSVDDDDNDKHRGVGDDADNVNNNNNSNSNNNNVLQSSPHSNGFLAKVRKSPLYFFYRNSTDGNTDTAV